MKIVGNIHGDEVVGRELVLGLAQALCRGWGREDAITKLLQVTQSHETSRMFDHFLPLFFSKDSENLKSLDIELQEVGAKDA